MDSPYYWLISINTSGVAVALVQNSTPSLVSSIGPDTEWTPGDPDSFLRSVDISLSAAAEKVSMDPEDEPSQAAFILPPQWIGNDGKIFPDYLKLMENLCHSLKLKPLGFISNDEAFIEALGKLDSFPPSFILLNLGQKEFTTSLVYLGEVKKRFVQPLDHEFSPQDLENVLLTIQMDSALPPRILIFGHLNDTIIDDIKNYPWIGRKNIETFLHLPDVDSYSENDLFSLYTRSIASELNPSLEEKTLPVPPPSPEEENSELISDEFTQVPAEELGFTNPEAQIEIPKEEIVTPPKKPKLNFPKINLPSLNVNKIKFNPLWLLLIALMPIFLLIPYFLIKADVTMYLKAIEIDKNFTVTLDSTADDLSSTTIPAHKKTINLAFFDSIPTTGEKEDGEKSKGDITILNQSNKIQNVPKGTILVTNGKNYEILTSAQVPGSSINLENATITMGQAKAQIIASDIGPEFDLAKDVELSFKDNSSLIAKTSDSISGGSKRQIRVVSTEDKNKLSKIITDSLDERIDQKVAEESSLSGLMPSTLFIDKKQLDFSREVGEEADELKVDANLTLSLLQIDPAKKGDIIRLLLQDNQEFLQSVASEKDFELKFEATKNASQKSTGKLTIIGKTLPKVEVATLQKKLAKQKISTAYKILDAQPMLYGRNIEILPKVFNLWQRLPPSPDKITIIQKL